MQKNFVLLDKAGQITKWNFAPDDWHCISAQNDLHVSGKMKPGMEAKDGSFGFDFEAVYDEVSGRKKITYSFADDGKVVANFENEKGQNEGHHNL
ncbi:MAG: hypothetical protein JST87_14825 [Bacteroidetes bacterium]|nr:hypothetical protein [Bacteroidota bacterium]